MTTKIEVNKYKPVDEITIDGLTLKSCYLNQYYQQVETGEILHAHYTDYDDSCYYERVLCLYKSKNNTGDEVIKEKTQYLGFAWTYTCIFDDCSPCVENGIAELDSERC